MPLFDFNFIAMKKIIISLLFVLLSTFSFAQLRTVKGVVSDGKNPMANVEISIENNLESPSFSNLNGYYEIEANKGDVLIFSLMGFKTYKMKIEDVTRRLNLIMVPDIQELDEVVVEASQRRSQEDMAEDYANNSNIIRTAWGYMDAERASGNVRILNEEDINPVGLCILDLLRNRFSGINVLGNCSSGAVGGAVFIRGGGSISNAVPAIFDIDGQITSNPPTWLDINNIKRIAILGNLASTVSYGSLGDGGVVVINTIAGSSSLSRNIDYAKLKHNFYQEDAISFKEQLQNAPVYLKDLYNSTSFSQATEIYNSYKTKYRNSPYFFLDAYDYFSSVKKNNKFAEKIINENKFLLDNNSVLLKALAYQYEKNENFSAALNVYKDVFILRPNYAQSYLDLAKNYEILGKTNQAANIYTRYNYLIESGFLSQDTLRFHKLMNKEFNNLLFLEGSKIVDSDSQNLYVEEENIEGTRLVFEWNDSEAEFELQFVNPEKQYHTWKHSMADMSEEIFIEKEFGYNVKEFLIDDSLPGKWLINAKYMGNKSLTPSYLKVTVYQNYGTKLQTKSSSVHKLFLKNVNQKLFEITTPKKIVSNSKF